MRTEEKCGMDNSVSALYDEENLTSEMPNEWNMTRNLVFQVQKHALNDEKVTHPHSMSISLFILLQKKRKCQLGREDEQKEKR